jgi:hypothetical protein
MLTSMIVSLVWKLRDCPHLGGHGVGQEKGTAFSCEKVTKERSECAGIGTWIT